MNKKFLNDNLEDNASDSTATNLHNSNYQSYDSPSSEASPYHDTDSVSDKSKKIRKKRNTYQKIDDVTRMNLLDAVQQGETLKAAAKKFNINYSSAKSILHTYRKEGRIFKKSAQERTTRRRNKAPSDMEMSPIYLSNNCQEDFSALTSTYESPEVQHRSPIYGYPEQESLKRNVGGVTFNSFGGFMKLGVQGQQRIEEVVPKQQPASTVVLRLDPKSLQSGVVNNNSVQRGNWQLSVNVRNDSFESSTASHKTIGAPQPKPQNALAISQKLKSFENFYMNYANSPLSRAVPIKKEQSQADSEFVSYDFNTFTDMMTCKEDPYDVSMFLNSTPALVSKGNVYDIDPFAGAENLSWMDNWRDNQDFFYDEKKEISLGSF